MDHISFTQLNMVLRCGIQYENRYVKGLILPPSGSMVRGRSCHKAEEINYKQKIETNQDIPIEAVKDYFSDEWEKGKYQIAWTEEEIGTDSPKVAEAKYKDIGVILVETYHKEIAPQAIPEKVEDKFTVEFQGGYPNLEGIIDRIDKGNQIIDAKFVSKSPPENDALKDIQLTCYDLGYRNKFKKKPSLLKKEFSIATKKPKTMILETEPRDDDTIQRFLRRLESAMISIEKGIFLPASNGSWICNPKWCGYWNECKFRP